VENTIKVDYRETGFDFMGWFDLAQDREMWRRVLVNMVMNFRFP
jgi:hypothetical protein